MTMMANSKYLSLCILLTIASCTMGFMPQLLKPPTIAFQHVAKLHHHHYRGNTLSGSSRRSSTRLNFFDKKMFEEEGILGKGITVGKIQIALISPDRSKNSIYGLLEENAREEDDLPQLTNNICLALLRKKDAWTAACSSSQWFGQDDWAKAESLFNDWSNKEALKFEKEFIPDENSEEKGGGSTMVVVSLIIEIQGDSTKFDGAGFSFTDTQAVLTSIASDCMVDDGSCLNAAEIFWTPSERDEVVTSRDLIGDFPELVNL